MKTNATMNKSNYFFPLAMLTKTKFGFFKTVLSVFLLLNIGISFAQGSSKATLKVESDRTNRSTTPKGTYYKMELTNSGSADTYDLSYVNDNEKGSNPDASSSRDNVLLKIVFLDKNLRPITQLKVNAGETVNFFAHIEVPQATSSDKWSTNKIIAISKSNSNYKVDTVLHTLVINSVDN